LDHHNIFFPRDIGLNLSRIFEGGSVAEDPSFYIHVPTVTDPSLAPPCKDIVYVLVPVPNLEATPASELNEERLRASVFERVRAATGIDLAGQVEIEHKFFPGDFIKRYNIRNGATFGLAHNLMQSAFLRPANFDRKWEGLYYVGASTQPGGGLPPVLAGSRIVADLITG
jgi:phytoene desaturase